MVLIQLSTGYSPNCGYILSISPDYNCTTRSINNSGWVGLSSSAIPAECEGVETTNLNYTKTRTILDSDEKKYRDCKDLHGLENAPEFYGMMPFIKI